MREDLLNELMADYETQRARNEREEAARREKIRREYPDIEKKVSQREELIFGTIHRILKDLRLFEVSVCTFPAYQKTAVGVREEDRAAASEENRTWRADRENRLKKLKKED